MNRIEKRIRNLVNPYSTAFARWWCHSGRYLSPGRRRATGSRRPGRTRPGANPRVDDAVLRRSSDRWLATQAARRTAVDELLASLDDGGEKAPDQG
jgi:hypothetical protein